MTLEQNDENGRMIDEESDYGQDNILEESEPDDSGQEIIQDFSEQQEEFDEQDVKMAPIRKMKKQ